MGDAMGFIDDLADKTGTERFVNSGVLPLKKIEYPGLELYTGGTGLHEFMHPGPRIYVSRLVMNRGCSLGPHFHPGTELAFLADGSYHDADMDGNMIKEYREGDWVWYNKWSSHRPLTNGGARIAYIEYNGIIIANNPADVRGLMEKAKKAGIQKEEDALEYALGWIFPNLSERQKILDEVFSEPI